MIEKKNYLFDTERQKYIFSLKSDPGPTVIDRADVDALVAAYSKQGGKATVKECAKLFGWRNSRVKEILRALDITHDSLPLTDEALAESSEDDLVEDVLHLKEQAVHKKAERAGWKKTQNAAEKWNAFERAAQQLVAGLGVSKAPARIPILPSGGSSPDRIDLVTHATDLHYGKYGWVDEVGRKVTRETCRDRLLTSTRELIGHTKRFGIIETVHLGMGGDRLHIDTHRGTTTAGTPQDFDGTFLQIVTEGFHLAVDEIEEYRGNVDLVKVMGVRGNHDYYSSAFLLLLLRERYREANDVRVVGGAADRLYTCAASNTLVGFTHGDGTDDSKLRSLMALEKPQLWGSCPHKLWITGHYHSQIVTENFGVTVEHFSSLASTDKWHKKKGYVGNQKALQGIVVTSDGPVAKITARAGYE